MTVKHILTDRDCQCVWFEQGKLFDGCFPPQTLRPEPGWADLREEGQPAAVKS